MMLIHPVFAIRHDAAVTAISSATQVQLNGASACTGPIKFIDVFDSTGRTLVLARGSAGVEKEEKFYIPPGGTSAPVPFAIAERERLSIRALDTSATAGLVIINCYR